MSIYDKSSLVLIPSGTKTSKVYSQKPTNGDGDFDFTRSTAATRVNADGNIEKETQNLLQYSNGFSNGVWSQLSITLTSGQAGYDGTNDAWLVTKTASYGRPQQALVSSGVQTLSVYAKAGTLNWVAVSNNLVYTYFDLSSGSIGTNVGTIDANIEDVGSGWYRCSITYTGNATDARFYPSQGDNDSTGTSGSIYIQDAQLEQSLVARDYIETTTTALYGGITDNVPRLDYTDSSCPALLLEPQRTNLVPHSEYLAVGWTYDNTSVISNSIVSPTGEISASKLLDNTTNGLHRMYYITGTSASAHTFSIFLKKGEYSKVEIESLSGVTTNITYDLLNGTATSVGEIEPYGNDWYRCIFPMSTTSSSNAIQIRLVNNSNSSVFVGTGTSGVHMFGAMLEAGSYATSYIPTYGTSVTRNGETALMSLLSYDLSGSFSIHFDFGKTQKLTSSSTLFCSFRTDNNDLQLYTNASGSDGLNVYLNGSNGGYVFNAGQNNAWSVDESKVCITYDANTGRLVYFINGVIFGEQTSLLSFGSPDTSPAIGSDGNIVNVNKYLFFNQTLTDQEAIALTTI